MSIEKDFAAFEKVTHQFYVDVRAELYGPKGADKPMVRAAGAVGIDELLLKNICDRYFAWREAAES